MAADNPIRDLWSRIRGLGRVVEDELYDFTEEDVEREDEPRGRNTLVALLNGFLTMWKATNANVAERTLGVAGFAGLIWFTIFDRGLGWRRWYLGLPAATFATVWFVPGLIAATWTVCVNLGLGNVESSQLLPGAGGPLPRAPDLDLEQRVEACQLGEQVLKRGAVAVHRQSPVAVHRQSPA